MAHYEQTQFIKDVRVRFPTYFLFTSILEVGSYNVNGTIRELFHKPKKYIGIDVGPGTDVDIVCHGADFVSDEVFDTVVSTECFEHDPRWLATFINMHKLCKQGGLVIFTCAANNRFEHGTTRTSPADSAVATDYYRNLNIRDFEDALDLRSMFSWYSFEARENDLYFWGVKK